LLQVEEIVGLIVKKIHQIDCLHVETVVRNHFGGWIRNILLKCFNKSGIHIYVYGDSVYLCGRTGIDSDVIFATLCGCVV